MTSEEKQQGQEKTSFKFRFGSIPKFTSINETSPVTFSRLDEKKNLSTVAKATSEPRTPKINNSKDFFEAIQKGHLQSIKEYLIASLDEGETLPVDLSQRNALGLTPILAAAKAGHPEIVQYFLDIEPTLIHDRVTTRDKDNDFAHDDSILDVAARKGNTNIVELLSDIWAYHRLWTDHGNSADQYAATTGANDIVRKICLLLKRLNDHEPLFSAVITGNISKVKELIEKQFDLSMRNRQGLSPVQLAIIHGHAKILTLLLEKNSNLINEITDAHDSLKKRRLPSNSPMAPKGFEAGLSLAELAVNVGDIECLQTLIALDPLHVVTHAAKALALIRKKGTCILPGDEDSFETLIKKGQTQFAGFKAIDQKDISQIKQCLTQGFDVNFALYGIPPLIYAVNRTGSTQMVELLLDHKADPRTVVTKGFLLPDAEGDNAFLHAAGRNQLDILKLLQKKDPQNGLTSINKITGETALHLAVKLDFEKVAIWLINQGADLTLSSKEPKTPWGNAAWSDRVNLINKFLEKKPDLLRQSFWWRDSGESKLIKSTALTIALRYRCVHVSELLLQKKAAEPISNSEDSKHRTKDTSPVTGGEKKNLKHFETEFYDNALFAAVDTFISFLNESMKLSSKPPHFLEAGDYLRSSEDRLDTTLKALKIYQVFINSILKQNPELAAIRKSTQDSSALELLSVYAEYLKSSEQPAFAKKWNQGLEITRALIIEIDKASPTISFSITKQLFSIQEAYKLFMELACDADAVKAFRNKRTSLTLFGKTPLSETIIPQLQKRLEKTEPEENPSQFYENCLRS